MLVTGSVEDGGSGEFLNRSRVAVLQDEKSSEALWSNYVNILTTSLCYVLFKKS